MNGNQYDKNTKVLIEKNEPEFVPSPEQIAAAMNKTPLPPQAVAPVPPQENNDNPLAKMIEKKVAEAVAKSLEKIDIGKMVEEAISKAFK